MTLTYFKKNTTRCEFKVLDGRVLKTIIPCLFFGRSRDPYILIQLSMLGTIETYYIFENKLYTFKNKLS